MKSALRIRWCWDLVSSGYVASIWYVRGCVRARDRFGTHKSDSRSGIPSGTPRTRNWDSQL